MQLALDGPNVLRTVARSCATANCYDRSPDGIVIQLQDAIQ